MIDSRIPISHGSGGPFGTTAPKTNRDTAEQFESMFISMMLKEVRENTESSLFSGDHMEMFADLWDQAISEEIRRSGGLGIADQIEQQLNGAGKQIPASGKHSFMPRLSENKDQPLLPIEGGRLTSSFGKRIDPFHGHEKEHHGMDIAAPKGTPIRAVLDGTVSFAGDRGGYGNIAIVRHSDGTETRYAHCDTLMVREGQTIKAGSVVGTVGSTGRSTGPHLHFEVRKDGKILDPAAWLHGNEKIPQQVGQMIRGGS